MKVLLINPIFPMSFYTFQKPLERLGMKAMVPPLPLATVAAILPQDWEFKLIDRNVEPLTEAAWEWSEMVMITGMIVQRSDMIEMIKESKKRNKTTVVGGPYATSVPDDFSNAGADFLVLDEGEITIPMFLKALEKGEIQGTFRSLDKPDISLTPVPRFDLFKMEAYHEMAVQYSRGCPFRCEFCDIIVLYGRKPRTKTSQQIFAELQSLFDLGWRGGIFFVDDNFIGNKREVKHLLKDLVEWQEKMGYPFSFFTEASVDLALDEELLELMTRAKFTNVFVGIETPDEASLKLTLKSQNVREPLRESIEKIVGAGIRIMAGFIIGFDGENKGAGERIYQFCQDNAIPTVTFSMLQALPCTGLSDRLRKEGRMLPDGGDVNQTTLLNFVPTRPIEEIADEYLQSFWKLYDPVNYLKRTYQHFKILGKAEVHKNPERRSSQANKYKVNLNHKRKKALTKIVWRFGVVEKTRWLFWKYLYFMYRDNKHGIPTYIATIAHLEHYLEYRELVKQQIEDQLAVRTSFDVYIPETKEAKAV
jgi:radical SAM superfamily enzyme YgiQ (UPF0313 family)